MTTTTPPPPGTPFRRYTVEYRGEAAIGDPGGKGARTVSTRRRLTVGAATPAQALFRAMRATRAESGSDHTIIAREL